MMNRLASTVLRLPLVVYGVALVAVLLTAGLVVFQRPMIMTVLTPGDTITATFHRAYRLSSYISEVKVAGVPVGHVTTLDTLDDGRSRVGLKLDPGTTDKLGTDPSAAIRPSTLLGGKYYVELVPGGDPGEFDGDIPVQRTRIAVELDAITETLQPEARQGLRQFVDKLDATLVKGGTPSIQKLAHDAPATLQPAASVFDAAGGNRPETLTTMIVGLDRTARTLTRQQGQLQDILSSFNTTAAALDRGRVPLSDTIGQAPGTLRTARTGLAALDTTLDKLTTTAPSLEPTAEALDPLLARLDPVLDRAAPLLADLRGVLSDAEPTVRDLAPAADTGTDVLDDLRGPVLDKVNGPILTALNSPWRGEGPYAGNGSPYRLYQDLAYALTNTNGSSHYVDKNGAALQIQVGSAGADGVADVKGLPNSEQLLRNLIGPKESPDARKPR